MAYFYNVDLENTTSSELANTYPFKNLIAGLNWSGTTYSGISGDAWAFHAEQDDQNGIPKTWAPESYGLYGLAVHPGDVAVPEPSTFLLL
jgi:hypothetical protein